jgi:peptidoglycan hydrolase-like protein with peptidoglycan-binding domain
MKKSITLPLALFLLSCAVWADDRLRNVQAELKSLGFYYGEMDGQTNAETTAALRRYQIRNGLEVTGTLTTETLAALGMAPKKSSAPPAASPPAPAAAENKPPVNLRRQETVEESDRNFLRHEETKQRPPDAVAPLAPTAPSAPRDASIIDPPAPLEAPSPDFPVLFSGTPYASAPPAVQQQTLRRAQAALASRGFYRDIVDGLPGPATEEALLTYQRAARLTLTGRLDLETLSELHLLPGPASYTDAGSFRPPQRVLRGIWIERR